MDGLETEGDLPPTKESNADRNYSGSAQVRSSSVIKGQEKLNNMAFQFAKEVQGNSLDGFSGIVGTGMNNPNKKGPAIENPKQINHNRN